MSKMSLQEHNKNQIILIKESGLSSAVWIKEYGAKYRTIVKTKRVCKLEKIKKEIYFRDLC